MASGSVGGMSGAFIPVSEDAGMIEAARVGALSLDKLEAWTSVCSVGIDQLRAMRRGARTAPCRGRCAARFLRWGTSVHRGRRSW